MSIAQTTFLHWRKYALAYGDPPRNSELPWAEAHALYSGVMQMLRLTIGESFDPKEVAPGVLRRIASAANAPDFRGVESDIAARRIEVRRIFRELLGP
jgi:glutamate-ammonia-ligase adenylyltransferase